MSIEKGAGRGTLRLGKPLPPAAAAAIARASGARDAKTSEAPKVAAVAVASPPTPATAEAQRVAWRIADLAVCRERYPALFDPDHPLPLAIGIHKQLGPVLGVKRAKRLLEWWCGEWRPYTDAVARGGKRYNLDGSEAGEVAEAARIIAREMWNQPGILQPQPSAIESIGGPIAEAA
jgi:hypothetical protein